MSISDYPNKDILRTIQILPDISKVYDIAHDRLVTIRKLVFQSLNQVFILRLVCHQVPGLNLRQLPPGVVLYSTPPHVLTLKL